jgi:hypothetical protein
MVILQAPKRSSDKHHTNDVAMQYIYGKALGARGWVGVFQQRISPSAGPDAPGDCTEMITTQVQRIEVGTTDMRS